ncbi:TPA: hypothetical protein DIS56_03310 [Candidatus Saccharibacteria bacterium]|nr:hypothetical protein [Candidatus Saccharibacteria bacterium]
MFKAEKAGENIQRYERPKSQAIRQAQARVWITFHISRHKNIKASMLPNKWVGLLSATGAADGEAETPRVERPLFRIV